MNRFSFSSPMIQNFQEFYNLVLRQKEFALRSSDINEPSTLEEKTEAEINNPLVDKIQRRLSILLDEQSMQSNTQVGEFSHTYYRDALYAMVALGDEIFLNLDWHGVKRWENNLLESRYFQTQIAGEFIFEKIEDLINQNDPMRVDLAVIYLMVLGMGFKGKYRNEDDKGKISFYRQQLYTLIHRHPPSFVKAEGDHLIPDCYEHVLDSTMVQGLPEIKAWYMHLES
jgi:type VI secretion system protein ImpK